MDKPVEQSKIRKILDAGRWAPSGLNNQPWRFVIVRNKAQKERLSSLTKYSYIIKRSDCLILVFLDKEESYHLLKDVLAIGACIENMLLCALELKVASCWLGEILNRKKEVNNSIGLNSRYNLMAAIAIGYSVNKLQSRRVSLKKLILREIK